MNSMQQQPSLSCPDCGSGDFTKAGHRYVKSETGSISLQRYKCKNCTRRFSESSAAPPKVPGSNPGAKASSDVDLLGSCISAYPEPNASTQKARRRGLPVIVGVPKGTKNLTGVEPQQKAMRGATTFSTAEIKGKLLQFGVFMEINAYKPAAVESYTDRIGRLITKGANLMDPEQVKRIIASVETWCDGSKKIMCDAYDVFVRMQGLSWTKPKYKYSPKVPFVPITEEIDIMIAGCSSKRLRVFLQGLKETGADPGELYALEWTEIDFTRKKVTINHPVKNHNPRILNVSDKWLRMLGTLPRNSKHVWGLIKYKSLSSNLRYRRKRLAHAYGNSRLNRVKFTSFRHWKGTMEYHKTHDIMYVKELLGHKSLLSTQVYVHLEKKLFEQLQSEYLVRRARSIKGCLALAAVGFTKFDEVGAVHLYRKQKTADD